MRAAVNDLMQGFRYHVTSNNADGSDILQPVIRRDGMGPEAGFQSITLPDISVEAVEYREGTFSWTQKYPGPPTVSDMTLMRGIAKRDTAFFDAVMASINGDEYRMDVTVYHYQRTEMGKAQQAQTDGELRKIVCLNAFAMRAKPAGDLDSMAGDVSLSEVDIAMESFKMNFN